MSEMGKLWPEEAIGVETSIDISLPLHSVLVSLSLFHSASARWPIMSNIAFLFLPPGLVLPVVHFYFLFKISQRNENILSNYLTII